MIDNTHAGKDEIEVSTTTKTQLLRLNQADQIRINPASE